MFRKLKKKGRKITAVILSLMTILMTAVSSVGIVLTVSAADGTLDFEPGEPIYYGSYSTTRMTFDGDNTAYCLEPEKKTPKTGSYEYQYLPKGSPIRKALYYVNGGYGYEKVLKNRCFSGWSDAESYVIGHLAVAYIYDDSNAGGKVFYGAPESYIDKTIEVVGVINSLPEPPQSFQAFIMQVEGRQAVAGSWYQVPCGWIELQKSTANRSITDGNANYSVGGAKYGIYQGAKQVAVITTDQKGYGKSGELETGNYEIRELQAGAGYALDTRSYEVTVRSEVTSSLKVTEVPQSNPLELLLQKTDAETGEGKPQAGGSLAQAEFTVNFYTEQMDTDPADSGKKPVRTWVFRTDEEGKVHFTKEYLASGDALYYQMDGETPCLPLGTVTVQETKAPEGYLICEKVQVQKITGSGEQESISCYQTAAVTEKPCRGDLEFVKVSDGDLQRLADVPFSITSMSTGESHVIVTDKNGYASTASGWVRHTANTNAGKTSSDGIWFGTSEPDDDRGALLYDTYVVEEQRCEANENRDLLKFEVTVYRDSMTVQLGTLTDDRIELETTALDKETGTHLAKPEESVTLVDTVEYEGLKKGKEYKVIGTLMDQETGELLLIDGKEVKAEQVFTAKKTSGKTEVIFTFNGLLMEGKTVVVFEELYQDGLQLAVHADLEDEGQTIHFPGIGTTAKDAETEEKAANADEEVTLIDTVRYRNLIPGKKYKMTGTLMDRDEKKVVRAEGEPVTAETDFVPEEPSGQVDVAFVFDGSELKGRTVVAFESMTYEGKEIAVHEDLDYEGQTVYFPEIKTTALEAETGSHIARADARVNIIDAVEYANLIPGREYRISGILMDKETKEAVKVGGEPVVSETVFQAEKAEGMADVSFLFDASELEGHELVVFDSKRHKYFLFTSMTSCDIMGLEVYYEYPNLYVRQTSLN